MANCPYCGDMGKSYGNGTYICVRCGSKWADKSAANKNINYSYKSTGSSRIPTRSGSSSSMGCGGKLVMLFLFMFLGMKIGGTTGAVIGMAIGIVLSIFK